MRKVGEDKENVEPFLSVNIFEALTFFSTIYINIADIRAWEILKR